MASAVATLAQLCALLFFLHRKLGRLAMGEVLASGVRHAGAALVMALVVWDLARFGEWSTGGNDPRNLAVFCACLAAGIAVYATVAYLLGCPELHELAGSVRRRRKR